MSAIKNISLYIPHIFANYTANQISNIFESQEIGKVKRVDLVEKMGKDNKAYNAAYIHFERWYNNSSAKSFQERVLSTEREARIMYDDPWYWIVLPNTTKKHPPSGSRKIKIDLTPSTPPNSPPNSPPPSPRVYSSPVKTTPRHVPTKNTKKTYSSVTTSGKAKADLESEFYYSGEPSKEELDEMEKQLDELDEIIDYENQFLTTIDSRYIYTIEQENQYLRYQIAVLQGALCAESIKDQLVAEETTTDQLVEESI